MLRSLRFGFFKTLAAFAAVSAVAITANAQNLSSLFTDRAAKVVTLTGQVSVLKDTQPWALNPGDYVNVRQVILTGHDGFAKFEVSDGSTFEVFPDSRVVFRNNPGNLRDLLDLMIGRVKVHIQKFAGQPNPNNVQTPTAVISVRGTTFDVTVEDDDATTLVVVEEGSVGVRHALMPGGDQKILNAGDYIRVYKTQPLAQKSVDKGGIIQRALNVASDAMYNILYRMPRSGGGIPGGGAGGGTTAPGDTGGSAPPPPPPDSGSSGPPPPPQ